MYTTVLSDLSHLTNFYTCGIAGVKTPRLQLNLLRRKRKRKRSQMRKLKKRAKLFLVGHTQMDSLLRRYAWANPTARKLLLESRYTYNHDCMILCDYCFPRFFRPHSSVSECRLVSATQENFRRMGRSSIPIKMVLSSV